jgi:cell wall-associated NlpC family hydrolase
MKWIDDYVGKPWAAIDNNCWDFVRLIWREHFGLEVPAVDVDAYSRLACCRALSAHDHRHEWVEVETPADGDAVLMGRSKLMAHVGVFVAGRVLHCLEGHGVVWQRLSDVKLSGLKNILFYRHRELMK